VVTKVGLTLVVVKNTSLICYVTCDVVAGLQTGG